jgi:AcrR family transcriptional regulator
MPKKIEHLREDILKDARRILCSRGYEALTMRLVAADCGIAVGTLYNYYPSKEMLAGNVMLEDWQKCLAAMKERCDQAASLTAGLDVLYHGIGRFARRYRSAWQGYAFCGSQQIEYAKRHNLLIEQTAACLAPLRARTVKDAPAGLDLFLAENVLACVNGSPLGYASFVKIAKKLTQTAEKGEPV